MPKLMLFITENVAAKLRGELTRWLLQLKPGVFLGTLSTRVGEKLWKRIKKNRDRGSAIWVRSMNNEQRFEIKTCGNTHWNLSDFDGLQLITHPHKSLQPIKITQKSPKKVKKVPKIIWNTENTPQNFITRTVNISNHNSVLNSSFSGTSAYEEYPPDKLWKNPWLNEIDSIGKSLLSYVLNLNNLSEQPFYGKKLVSLDIETTDFLPKAYEGFINIIGISTIDLRVKNSDEISLHIFQIFNMTRKKHLVDNLLNLLEPYLKEVDDLIVFNQNFDISILNKVIDEFSSNLIMPNNTVDLKNRFSSLEKLEIFLKKSNGVQRSVTKKGIYSDYYRLFKGEGKNGKNKQIEPIGTYNITDTLTPLFVYLILGSNVSHSKH